VHQREISSLHDGRPLIQGGTFHTTGTPLHGYDGGPGFLQHGGAAPSDSELGGE
jgi:hypothetical protein